VNILRSFSIEGEYISTIFRAFLATDHT